MSTVTDVHHLLHTSQDKGFGIRAFVALLFEILTNNGVTLLLIFMKIRQTVKEDMHQLPCTGRVGTQSILMSVTAPVTAWFTYTKQYSTYRSENRSQWNRKLWAPGGTRCSAT